MSYAHIVFVQANGAGTGTANAVPLLTQAQCVVPIDIYLYISVVMPCHISADP